MAKQARSRRRHRRSPSAARGSSRNAPTPAAEVLTVAWMLALLATLAAELMGVATWGLIVQTGVTYRLRMCSTILLAVAAVSGIVTLLLTPVVLKLRSDPPPRPIVVTALIGGTIPIATVLVLAWR